MAAEAGLGAAGGLALRSRPATSTRTATPTSSSASDDAATCLASQRRQGPLRRLAGALGILGRPRRPSSSTTTTTACSTSWRSRPRAAGVAAQPRRPLDRRERRGPGRRRRTRSRVRFAAGDLDGDGDTDLLLRLAVGRAPRCWRNEGGDRQARRCACASPAASATAAASAPRSRCARAASPEARDLRRRRRPRRPPTCCSASAGATAADAVRVIWPSGDPADRSWAVPAERRRRALVEIKELDRKPSSCPYPLRLERRRLRVRHGLHGRRRDGLLRGARASGTSPTRSSTCASPTEQLRAAGRPLRAARHQRARGGAVRRPPRAASRSRIPSDVEVYPYEGMTVAAEAGPHRSRCADARPPRRGACDDHGHDVLDRLRAMDRRYPDDFRLRAGSAATPTSTRSRSTSGRCRERAVLLLTGWTDYAFSSDNVAAHQARLDDDAARRSRWRTRAAAGSTAIEQVGIPVGRPQTVVVDLTGMLEGSEPPRPDRRRTCASTGTRSGSADVVDAPEPDRHPASPLDAPAARARLLRRGLAGRPRALRLRLRARLAAPRPGRRSRAATRARATCASCSRQTDDVFVISRPGDEIALSFDARALPRAAARAGRGRSCCCSDGFSKEMDIHSATPDALGPAAVPRHEPLPVRRARRPTR